MDLLEKVCGSRSMEIRVASESEPGAGSMLDTKQFGNLTRNAIKLPLGG